MPACTSWGRAGLVLECHPRPAGAVCTDCIVGWLIGVAEVALMVRLIGDGVRRAVRGS